MQLTVRDVAKILRVSERDIYRWIEDDELPAYRVSNQFRFNRADLLEWATSHQIPIAAELFPQGLSTVKLSLAQSLESGGVFYGIQGPDKPAILRTIAQTLPLPPTIDREHLLRIFMAREALASTGIGDGIAVPHVRNPIIFPVVQSMAVLFFLERPVPFGALDGKPVHTLFALVSPTVRTHLQLLSRLAFSLRNPAFRERIVNHAGKEEILATLRSVEASFKESTA